MHASRVGIDHALYRLSLRDRGLIRWIQLGILALLGSGLAWSLGTGRVGDVASCALVALHAEAVPVPMESMTCTCSSNRRRYALLEMERSSSVRRRRLACAAVMLQLALFVNPAGCGS